MTVLTLVGGDLLAVVAGIGAWLLTASAVQGAQALGPGHVLVVVVAIVASFSLADLYPGAGVSPVDELRAILLILTAMLGGAGILFVAEHRLSFAELMPIVVAYAVTLVATLEIRIVVRELLGSKPWWGVAAIVIGSGRTARSVIESLERKPQLNLKIVACLDDDASRWGTSLGRIQISGPVSIKASEYRRNGANYAIVARPRLGSTKLVTLVHRLSRVFGKVVVIPNAFRMTSVGVGTRDSGVAIGFYVRGHFSQRRNLYFKRALDVVLLLPLALAAVPLILLGALAILVVSPGNPFYAQERYGLHGRKVRMWKLRTMHTNSDEILERHLTQQPDARLEWNTHFKLKDDPRVIPIVGSLLRRLSLDELPQLLNIARGELSFVGPRPFPDYHLRSFDEEFRALRSTVRPGLTGYWQVTSRSSGDLAIQVELDSYYITNWSPWLDLYVIARTPWAVLFGKGAY